MSAGIDNSGGTINNTPDNTPPPDSVDSSTIIDNTVASVDILDGSVAPADLDRAYVEKNGDTMLGSLDMGSNALLFSTVSLTLAAADVLVLGAGDFIRTGTAPVDPQDLVNKAYVDSVAGGGSFLPLAGGTMSGNIDMGTNDLFNSPTISSTDRLRSIRNYVYKDATYGLVVGALENAGNKGQLTLGGGVNAPDWSIRHVSTNVATLGTSDWLRCAVDPVDGNDLTRKSYVTDELANKVNNTTFSDHLTDAVDAHDASAISNVPAGEIAATDVQAALNELDNETLKVTGGAAQTTLRQFTFSAAQLHTIKDVTTADSTFSSGGQKVINYTGPGGFITTSVGVDYEGHDRFLINDGTGTVTLRANTGRFVNGVAGPAGISVPVGYGAIITGVDADNFIAYVVSMTPADAVVNIQQYETATGTTAVDADTDTYIFNNTTGAASANLPASPSDGRRIDFTRRASGGGNTGTILGNGKNINGAGSLILNSQYQSYTIEFNSDVDEWMIL